MRDSVVEEERSACGDFSGGEMFVSIVGWVSRFMVVWEWKGGISEGVGGIYAN